MIYRKQLYTTQTNSRWKKVNKMRHFTVIADLNVAQKKSSIVTYLFFLLIWLQYMSALLLVKRCGFVMRFVILAIYFQLKTAIFNLKT